MLSNNYEDENISRNMSFRKAPAFSFSKNTIAASRLTPFGLWRLTTPLNKLLCLLLGPALALIPPRDREDANLEGERQHLFFTVHGITFGCTAPGYALGPGLYRPATCEPSPDEEKKSNEGGSVS